MKNIIALFLVVFFAANSNAFAQSVPQNVAQKQAPKTLSNPPRIVSSINPVYQIAKFISGDEKNNSLLIYSNVSEYNYIVKPADITKISSADVLFYVSDSLESTLATALPQVKGETKIVQLIKSTNISVISYQSRLGREVVDPNIWLSPTNAIGMAAIIADTLSELYPQGKDLYQKNLAQFSSEVLTMDNNNKSILAVVEPRSFVVDLDRFAYFEQYYHIPDLTIIRSRFDEEPTQNYVASINQVIKASKPVCVLGTDKQQSGLAWQISNNNRLKFTLIDVIGNSSKYSANGYVEMMQDIVNNLVKCAGKTKQ